jgi:predicted permease
VSGVLDGFVVIGLVIGLGVGLAQAGLIDEAGQRTLTTLAFSVATPALLFTLLQRSDVVGVFSGSLVASAGGVAAVGVASVAASRARRRPAGEAVIAALSAGYCNAANLGLPIASYVLGDAGLIAPVMLLQVAVLQPAALAVLDVVASGRPVSTWMILSRPLRNPITLASFAGLGLAIAGGATPEWLDDAVTLVGDMSVPSMLLAFGVSLRLGPMPGRGLSAGELGWHVGLKLLLQPFTTFLIARFVLGLSAPHVLAVTVIAALPTAQNIFVIATRYDQATLLARDVIFVSTLACVPVILVISALLG